MWPESRMTLPLGLPPREYPQEVPRSSRADLYGTIANFYCRRRTRRRGSRLRCTQGQVMTLGVTVTRRSPCSANTSTYIRTKVERRPCGVVSAKGRKARRIKNFSFSFEKKKEYIHRDIPSYWGFAILHRFLALGKFSDLPFARREFRRHRERNVHLP